MTAPYPESYSLCVYVSACLFKRRVRNTTPFTVLNLLLVPRCRSHKHCSLPLRDHREEFHIRPEGRAIYWDGQVWDISLLPLVFPQFGPTWSRGQCQCFLGIHSSPSWSPANQEQLPSLLMASNLSTRTEVWESMEMYGYTILTLCFRCRILQFPATNNVCW